MPKPTYVVLAVKDERAYDRGEIHHVEYAGQSTALSLDSIKHSVMTGGLWVIEEWNGNKLYNARLFSDHHLKYLIFHGEVL